MKKLLFALSVLLCTYVNAQQASALPEPAYMTMVKACTSADIIMLQGNAGSMNVDEDNIALLEDYITRIPIAKPTTPQTATIMCLIHGEEFVSGSIYVNDKYGAVVFNIGGVEYVNMLNSKGTDFFRTVASM